LSKRGARLVKALLGLYEIPCPCACFLRLFELCFETGCHIARS
jgi:hypothetical protein